MTRIMILVCFVALWGVSLAQDCVDTDLEDLAVGTVYTHGDTFTTGDITITVATFFWGTNCTSSPFDGGHARVDASNSACGTGKDLNANNVNLEMDFGGVTSEVALLYGHHGGNLNLTINGDCRNFSDFSAVDGKTIGGVLVRASTPAGCGQLKLTGTILSFSIGGQELWLDDLHACRPCPSSHVVGTDFEDLVLGTTYFNGNVFHTGDLDITVEKFYWGTNCTTSPFTGGHARVDDASLACGTGKDLNANNVNLAFNFGGSVTDLSLRYGHHGGNLNLTINGVCNNFSDFSAVDGKTIGGVLVRASTPAGCGVLSLKGTVTSFSIGGQELWIDDVSACLDRLLFIRGDANADGSTDISDAVAILNYLFLGVKKVPCEQAGDINDDGALDISDAVYELRFLFLGGKPIEPPVKNCGVDPTGHKLGCGSFPRC